MKKRILTLGLALCFLLTTGCASMLERSYTSSSVHVDRPTTGEDPSVLRVENYRELVSAVLYLVSQGAEEGIIQLHNYAGQAENDLAGACREVTTEDPLGAYAVEYIKHECTRVVSYDQAALSIHYRRTPEQVRSIVNVTGSSAIRTELQEALSRFEPEVVLRVAYFAEDADSLAQLIRQAYYDAPAAALGFPQVQITLYPDSGRERVVEISLTYLEAPEEMRRKMETLSDRSATLSGILWPSLRSLEEDDAALRIRAALQEAASYDPEGGSTPYAALVDGEADGEGLALAYTLLCRQANLTCEVVEGTRLEEPWFWNSLTLSTGETLYLDPVEEDGQPCTAQELFELGYRWSGGPVELSETEESLEPEEDLTVEEGPTGQKG